MPLGTTHIDLMVNSAHLRYSTIDEIAHQKIVPTQIKKVLLGCTFLALAGLLASCGGSSSGGIYNQAFNVSGQWSGTLTETGSTSSPVNVTLSDSGSAVTGTLIVTGHTCFTSGNLAGTSIQSPSNSSGDNPLTGDQENSNEGTTSLILTTEGGSKGVASVTVSNGGSSYTTAPTVTFTSPEDSSGETAEATAVIESGAVIGIIVTKPGSGYALIPGISFSGGDGSGAVATAVLSATANSITITLNGNSRSLGGSYSGTWSNPGTTCGVVTQGTAIITKN